MKTLHQTVTFSASPHDIYEMLMDSKKHEAFTGDKAKISRKVGGKISAYDGWIEGENVELIKDKKIVQTWRGVDWPKGRYSLATFELEKAPGDKTKLKFTQKDIPDNKYEDIKQGWIDHYWNRMKEYLE
jgi:activator of HSP90 ATPase